LILVGGLWIRVDYSGTAREYGFVAFGDMVDDELATAEVDGVFVQFW